ncbi:hypothetical protein BKA93DRAFT_885233 [Sparassis latifolia]
MYRGQALAELYGRIVGLRDIIEQPVRLWCLQIPLPNIAPIILAALPISNNVRAPELFLYLEQILTGLHEHQIKVVSYACDGATIERNTSSHHLSYKIQHPVRGCAALDFSISCFNDTGQPIVMLQDPKHGSKTMRNNAFSGAILLILGNEPVMYPLFRKIAFEDGPLFRRDVEKIDRQDDNAACRLFAADTVQWLTEHNVDEHLGVIVYLFVFGELMDAYLSRHLSHIERIRLALRAFFFMDMWESFLERAGYSKAKHFISPQARAIVGILIRGIIQLVYVYRDHLNGRYPLMPWLLTTETCEHVFGLCRVIVKDFTMLDFVYMVPKLLVQLQESALKSRCSNASGKARAQGYNHTHTDSRGADLANLRTFPSDEDINAMAIIAHEEAQSLFALLGVFPETVSSSTHSTPSWSVGPAAAGRSGEDETDSDYVSDTEDGEQEAEHLDGILAAVEEMEFSTERREDEVRKLTHAAISLSVEESMKIASLVEWEEHEEEEILADVANVIEHCLTESRGPALDSSSPSADYALQSSFEDAVDVDIRELITLRRSHQTKQAASGVRTRGQTDDAGQSPRRLLLRQFQDIIKQEQERGVGSGLERAARWKNPGISGSSEDTSTSTAADREKSGNAANAAAVATSQAKKLLTRRRGVYKSVEHFNLAVLQEGGVSSIAPLCPANSSQGGPGFAFFLLENSVKLGRVLSIYTKGGGTGNTHGYRASRSLLRHLTLRYKCSITLLDASSLLSLKMPSGDR